MTEMGVTGGYVRHRDRMIQESVFEDLTNTLIACRWMAGTTSRPVTDPYNPSAGRGIVTTSDSQVLALLDGNPVVLIDYFPETEGSAVAGQPSSAKTAPNTLAVDAGTRGESRLRELGSNAEDVPYRINMAFYASSDAVAMALLNDLVDRYRGRLVHGDTIDLWNYNDPSATTPVSRMDVDAFTYTMNVDSVAPYEIHLYFGQLLLTDYVD